MLKTGQILNTVNLNSAFVSKTQNEETIAGVKRFSNDLYSTKLIAATSNWSDQLILMHDGTNANIINTKGNLILARSLNATEDITFRADSNFAGITLNGDKANTSGEPGGSYVLFTVDGNGSKASIGLTQTLGKDSLGETYTNALENAFILGSKTANVLQFGTNASVALTIDTLQRVGIGTTSPSEKLEVSGNAKATTFISTASTGTAPFTVTSTTVVTNLNADMVDGYNASTSSTASTIAVRDSNGDIYAGSIILSNEIQVPTTTALNDVSITCSSDQDTGINFSAADTMDLIAGGTKKAVVNTDGLNANKFIAANSSMAKKFSIEYNETDDCLDFIYVG